MTYRQDLAAAHGRIAHLEQELAARDREAPGAPSPAPTTEAEPAPPIDASSDTPYTLPSRWRAWPLLPLVASTVAYGIRFDRSTPIELTYAALEPFGRVSLLCVMIGSFLMTLAWMTRPVDGSSSIAQRLLTVVAIAINAPLVVIGGFYLLEVGSVVLGVVVCVAMGLGALWSLIKWIAGRS